MSKYIVWLDYYSEGWKPSQELETFENCFEYLQTDNYGNPYLITKTVDIEFRDLEQS